MILVTGATGLVGSHLVLSLLQQGQRVRALYRSEQNKGRVQKVFEHYNTINLFQKIEWVQADVLDVPALEEAFQDVDYVYHCAAFISFNPDDEEKLRKVNIEGTANIVNFCLDKEIKKLCYVSSIAALGDLKEFEKEITEETDWNSEVPHNDYAISKYGAEIEVWRAYQEGLNVVIVNPGVILGPLFWEEGSGDIYKKVKSEIPFYTTGGTGFVSVLDLVKTMIFLQNSEISGERFTIVSETKTYQEITNLIAEKLGVKKPKYEAKKWMTGMAWKIDWFLGLFGKTRVLSKDMARSLHNVDHFDTSKIERVLPFQFENIQSYINGLHI
ncbi:MAG: NAD-dependent epimerase/dehydratase family protein [Limnohabitans sp.]|nr:NAD-dependent epimerase/dehydratase family protein [Limnohabitans sp.]